MPELYLKVHGLRIRFESDDPLLVDFVARNYGFFKTAPFSESDPLAADLSYSAAMTAETGVVHEGLEIADFRRLGRATLLGARGLVEPFRGGYWRLVERQKGGIDVRIAVRRPSWLRPRWLWSLLLSRPRVSGYRYLTRYVIEPTMFWLLRRQHGLFRLHAAAIARAGGAVILAGPSGVGKSTLALYLWKKRGWKILGDNSCLFDSEQVYCFPECPRVFPATLQMLEAESLDTTAIEGRRSFELNAGDVLDQARPACFIYLVMRAETAIEPLDSALAAQRLLMHHLFIEREGYLTLNLLFPETEGVAAARATIARLLEGVPCYTLSLSRFEPLEKAAALLDKLPFASPRALETQT